MDQRLTLHPRNVYNTRPALKLQANDPADRIYDAECLSAITAAGRTCIQPIVISVLTIAQFICATLLHDIAIAIPRMLVLGI